MSGNEMARSRDEILAYLASQMPERQVGHLERVTVEHVMSQRHEVWDVHIDDGTRWWVVTNPTNFYTQDDFKSRDVVLTFHLGLTMRLAARHRVPVNDHAREMFEAVWRRWQQAVDALVSAEEAEHFQAVGTHLRETLISLADEVSAVDIVPEGVDPPKASDAAAWLDLFARAMAPGKESERVRGYVLSLIKPTWDYQQHLLHRKNATRMDAEIGAAAVEHLIAILTALVLRTREQSKRCGNCEAYGIVASTCRYCGWEDPEYAVPELLRLSDAEIAEALISPHALSSDISTLMTVDSLVDKKPGTSTIVEEPGKTTKRTLGQAHQPR